MWKNAQPPEARAQKDTFPVVILWAKVNHKAGAVSRVGEINLTSGWELLQRNIAKTVNTGRVKGDHCFCNQFTPLALEEMSQIGLKIPAIGHLFLSTLVPQVGEHQALGLDPQLGV